MRAVILLSVAAAAHAFNFGGFTLPSIPILPTIPPIPSIEFPSIPELPSIPADFASLIPEKIPSFAFNRSSEFPSIPEIPSLPSLIDFIDPSSIDFDSYRTAIPDYKSLVPTAVPDPNEILKSLGVSALPTLRVPSRLPPIPSIDDFGLRENDLLDWRRNHTLKVPESEQELREFIGNHTKFDFNRADALVDRLSEEVGADIRPSIRMIAGLVLNNQSFDQVYKRATTEFTVYTQRFRDGAKNIFNFTESKVSVPSMLGGANLTLSVVKYAQNPYSALSDQRLNSSVISIMVGDLAGNETRVRDLSELLNFTLPVDAEDGACVFWNETVSAWSTDGCQLLKVVDGIATCGCNHLTDFAFIASSAAPSLSSSPNPTQTTYILIAAAPPPTPTPNGTSPLVIGLASAGSVLAAVLIAAAYMNWRHVRQRRLMKTIPGPTFNNPITQVVVL